MACAVKRRPRPCIGLRRLSGKKHLNSRRLKLPPAAVAPPRPRLQAATRRTQPRRRAQLGTGPGAEKCPQARQAGIVGSRTGTPWRRLGEGVRQRNTGTPVQGGQEIPRHPPPARASRWPWPAAAALATAPVAARDSPPRQETSRRSPVGPVSAASPHRSRRNEGIATVRRAQSLIGRCIRGAPGINSKRPAG